MLLEKFDFLFFFLHRRPSVPTANGLVVFDMDMRGEILRPAHRPSLRAAADPRAEHQQRPRRASRLPRARAIRQGQGHHRLHAGDTRAT